MIELFRAAPYVRMHRGATMVVKAGGSTLARPALRRQLARQLAVVDALGARLVVVHGGGPQTDDVQRLLGEEPQKVDGRRVTSATALRALRMATIGELNGEVVAALEAEGARAAGLCVASASMLVAAPRPPMVTSRGVVEFGAVGDVRSADPSALMALLEAGIVPVVAPPAGDGKGGFLNVNADVAAAELAIALCAEKLVLLTDVPGILRDVKDPNTLVSALSAEELDLLIASGALGGGMAVKATAIQRALAGGVGRVHVVSGTEPEALLRELYTTQGAGTLLTMEPEAAPVSAAAEQEVGA
jgi:acetylglutamate kinase